MIAGRCGSWERSFESHTGGWWRLVSRCSRCSSSRERTRLGTPVRVSSATSGADPTPPDHQQHYDPPHDFAYRGPCGSLRVPQPADCQCCWAECGVLRHGFCGSRSHAFRWRRVIEVEPRSLWLAAPPKLPHACRVDGGWWAHNIMECAVSSCDAVDNVQDAEEPARDV